jgi:Mce-associated membrane protein
VADAAAQPDDRLKPRGLKWVFVFLLVALVGLSTWAGFLVDKTYRADNRESDVAKVREVAGQTGTAWFSISYQTFDQDYRRFLTNMDSQMKSQASQISSQAKQSVTQSKLTSHGTLEDVGLTTIDRKTATVIVAVSRTATSTQIKTPQTAPGRLQVTLTKEHGQWLVSNLKPVQ